MATPKTSTLSTKQRRKTYRVETISNLTRFNEIFADIERRLSAAEGVGQNVDMLGKKAVNSGAGTRDTDGATVGQLNDAVVAIGNFSKHYFYLGV